MLMRCHVGYAAVMPWPCQAVRCCSALFAVEEAGWHGMPALPGPILRLSERVILGDCVTEDMSCAGPFIDRR